ncbi:neuromedin-S isoform X1 [Electrophorus electricus]|uniref:neuromedin-S isoform X1 n=1 Tax=Electrophorus electricus TaxID=8005 RepID=UPI0015CF9A99|nr:neuromedin-S isoform X1 [Electrophorus electricus]
MGDTFFRQLYVLYIVIWCITSFYLKTVESYPLSDCEVDGDYNQGSDLQSTLCGLIWRDHNQEQIQNVFKRFLFHYSKAQNSLGSVERESHFVHPLMRLSPKFTQRRKKQQASSLKGTCSHSDRLV